MALEMCTIPRETAAPGARWAFEREANDKPPRSASELQPRQRCASPATPGRPTPDSWPPPSSRGKQTKIASSGWVVHQRSAQRPASGAPGPASAMLLLVALLTLGGNHLTGPGPARAALDASAGSASSSLSSSSPATNDKPFASMLNSAVLNGKALLACDIQPPSSDDSVALVLWYKDDSLAPIYTVDARKVSSLDKAKISYDEQYANRINFKLRTRPAQLQLDNVRQEDEGDYRCRVDFKRGRTVNTIILLRVVIPPSELSILASAGRAGGASLQPGPKLTGLIGPFNEGDQLELVCLAHGGKPRPQLSWRRDFNVINSTHQTVDKEGTSVVLKIPSLNKSHLLSIFTCEASNNNITSPLQSSITLDLNLKPQEVSLRQLNHQEPLLVGQTATFDCSSQGSRPQATLHWLFQGTRHDPPMNVDQQQSSSRLSLTLQRSFNQQPLSCVAENPRIPQASARQTIKLDVHYAPQLSIRLEQPAGSGAGGAPAATLEPADSDKQPGELAASSNASLLAAGSQLQEGNDIYLTCQLDANPRPVKPILWRFNGRPLHNNQPASSAHFHLQHQHQEQPPQAAGAWQAQQQFIMSNQSLVLRKVVRQQSGMYTCEASNQHGSGTSRPLELTIRHAPVCQTEDVLVYESSVGQTIQLDCLVQANPSKSVQFSWSHLVPPASLIQAPRGSVHATGPLNDTSWLANEQLASWLRRASESESEDSDGGGQTGDPDDNSAPIKQEASEQLSEEQSGQLRFQVKDEASSYALIKCRAKNEIGLQQRPCLFQLVPSRAPQLRHICSLANDPGLASYSSTSLQVNCKPSEHLKTRESELLEQVASHQDHQKQHQQSALTDPMMRRWRLSGGQKQAAPSRRLNRARRRWVQVYPPSWIFGELYKAQNGTLISNSSVASNETLAGPSGHDFSTASAASVNYELAAYVIVGPSGQLARIKSIVEANQVLRHLQPRDIYYVPAKQGHGVELTAKQQDNHNQQQATATNDNLVKMSQQLDLAATARQVGLIDQIDDAIQLGDEFNFTIPSLEPETRYKLLIYGQNLAGEKTTDWLVIRGETLKEDLLASARSQTIARAGSTQDGSNSRQHPVDGSSQHELESNDGSSNSSWPVQQKSIVMRSESLQDEGTGAHMFDNLTSGHEGLQNGEAAAHHRYLGSSASNSSATKLQEPLAIYKDYAIYYAKQKPLLAIPVALGSCLVFLFAVIWLSGLFVGLVRRHRRNNTGRQSQQQQNHHSDMSNSSSLDTKSTPPDDNSLINGNHLMCSSENEKLLISKAAHAHHHSDHQTSGQQVQFLSNESTNDGSFTNSTATTIGARELDQHHHHHLAAGHQINHYLIEADDENDTEESRQQPATVYAIDDRHQLHHPAHHKQTQLLDAIALEQLYSSQAYTLGEQQQQQHLLSRQQSLACKHGQQQFLGSLDRRLVGINGFHFHQEPMVQLAPDVALAEIGQVAKMSFAEHQKMQKQRRQVALMSSNAAYLASIERRPQQGPHQQQVQRRRRSDFDQHQEDMRAGASSTDRKLSPQPCSRVANGPRNGSGQPPGRRSHVAFDLGTIDKQQNHNMDQEHADPVQHQHQHQALVTSLGCLKMGSDSGTLTTTANTDSGHESPATGELTSFTTTGQQLLMHQPPPPAGARRSRPDDKLNTCCCSPGRTVAGEPRSLASTNGGQQQQQMANNGMFMLLELSPGSQESSTLLQSVESFGEPLPSATLVSTILHPSQQVATSFTSREPRASNNHQHS